MPDDNIIAFPASTRTGDDFQSWLTWVECELTILGHDIQVREHDWRQDYDCGKRPEEAAAEAARRFESS